ncbi:MAG TPA: hypothetical protein VKA74_14760, partial [Myxococcota bacterium]|nr:hypothetical protein [Myxococcota bacterium]
AEEIARSLVEFTTHSRQMDKTMEALRLEIHEESRRLQGTGSELGRRLKLASDAVGLLESATSEAARRSRLEPTSASGLARERHWASLPVDRDRDPDREPFPAPARSHPVSPDPILTRSPETESAPESEAVARPIAETRRDGASFPPSEPASEPPSEAGIGSATEATGAEWERERSRSEADAGPSGYRLGAPRAQGPDPYARFEGRSEPPSNLRHFPTRERELGEDLKLSGLLGPSSRSDAEPPARDEPGRPGSEGFEDDDPGSGGHAHPKPEPS